MSGHMSIGFPGSRRPVGTVWRTATHGTSGGNANRIALRAFHRAHLELAVTGTLP
jgi:hypothetical protein